MPEIHLEAPAGSVIITPAQMYDTVIETRDLVKRLESSLTPELRSLREDTDQNAERIEILASRVSALERWRWGLVAAGATGLLGGGTALSQIINAANGG